MPPAAPGLFISIGLHNDVRMLFIDIEFIDAQFDVHIDGEVTVVSFMPSPDQIGEAHFLAVAGIFAHQFRRTAVNGEQVTPATASSGSRNRGLSGTPVVSGTCAYRAAPLKMLTIFREFFAY